MAFSYFNRYSRNYFLKHHHIFTVHLSRGERWTDYRRPQRSPPQSLSRGIKHRPCPGSVNICPPPMKPPCHMTSIQSLLHVFLLQPSITGVNTQTPSDGQKLIVHLQWMSVVSSDCTMWRLLAGFVLLLCAADATPVGGRTVPDFGKMYHVKGELNLPYSGDSGETEPFEVWYDLEGNRSRIDYRNSTVRTYLIGNDLDYGVIYKITPVNTETEIQAIKYFQLNGTKEDPIGPQAALPDLQGFEFEKMEDYAGVQCEVWKKVAQAGHKKNTYRLWVKRPEGNDSPAVPYHFEMVGFNTLLGSHNDKYTIDYSDFSSQTESDIFTPPGGMTYVEFPDPPEEHQILANPLQDYVSTSPVSHATVCK